jgi:hypothetical protein
VLGKQRVQIRRVVVAKRAESGLGFRRERHARRV